MTVIDKLPGWARGEERVSPTGLCLKKLGPQRPGAMSKEKLRGAKGKMRHESLVSIHRRCVQNLLRARAPENHDILDPRIQKLARLKRQRIALAAELESLNDRQTKALCQQLRERQRFAESTRHRPYLQGLDQDATVQACRRQAEKEGRRTERRHCQPLDGQRKAMDTIVSVEMAQQNLLLRMHEFRRHRKLSAAYRLLGRTLSYPCHHDDVKDILGLRIDISMGGWYVAFHYVFFELVACVDDVEGAVDDSESVLAEKGNPPKTLVQLQLKQHTLPNHMGCMEVLEKYFGSSLCLGPFLAHRVDCESLISRLQLCSEELHHLCHVHAVRRMTMQRLRLAQTQSQTTLAEGYAIDQVERSSGDTSVSFRMRFHESAALGSELALRVQLVYNDPRSPHPSNVTVTSSSQRREPPAAVPGRAVRDVVSDDEDEEDTELSLFAESALRSSFITDALDAIARQVNVTAPEDQP